MPRAVWTGVISFGLVTIPVRMYRATSPHRPAFRQFERGSGQRIRHRRVADGTGAEVAYGDVVKGAAIGDGRHVLLTAEELKAVEPDRSRALEVEDFVDLAAIDPVVWNTTYYLGPDGEAAETAYELLRRAMVDTGKVAIGRFVMRDREHLATVRPIGGALGLSTMWFADEVRRADAIDRVPVDREPDATQLEIARQLIGFMSTEWDHARYRDTYHERVAALIERKAHGDEVIAERAPEPAEKAAGLLEALRRSVAERARVARERG